MTRKYRPKPPPPGPQAEVWWLADTQLVEQLRASGFVQPEPVVSTERDVEAMLTGLGASVRRERRRLGMTLQDLGRKVGMTTATLIALERRGTWPRAENFAGLARALQVDPCWLLNPAYMALPPEKRALAHRVLDALVKAEFYDGMGSPAPAGPPEEPEPQE